ncbi:hypothetical protein DFH08DRAFT_828545 [Mycena albidolilacea]|uniref:Uncharacterized protein n=1 Tax=Mycena albidolilacea TaxID=1033008 RepID=A0AAD6YWE7_9AGAR|nr:hypothetical protein DFH08DRAFT_828545 [Mycena albidolilacea]
MREMNGSPSSQKANLPTLRIGICWVFPCTQEFPDEQPLRDTFLLADHVTLQRIARPALHALAAFLAKGRVYDDTDIDHVVQLFDDAIAPENAVFRIIADEFHAGRLSAHIAHAFCNSVRDLVDYLPADRRNTAWATDLLPEDPAYASLLIPAWFSIPRGPHKDSLEEPYPVQGSHAGTYSPCYEPSTPPERSLTPILRPATPPAQLGPSAVGSASFDIRQLLGSAKKDPPTLRKASAIAAADLLVLPLGAGKLLAGAHPLRIPHLLPYIQFFLLLLRDKKGQPMIKIKSSQKSVTPPASEAYNEEGEEEKDEEEEEEEEEVPPRPAKHRRTAPALPKSKTPGKSKGKGKAQVETPALADLSSTFPIPVRKTHGKSKKAELPAYVPPQPFDAGCSNCILRDRDRECDHGAPRSLCEHCEKGRLSHCSHNFSVVDHARTANHLEPYTRLSNERGNELITDLSAARADYELAREQLFRASARIAVASNRLSTWICGVITNLGVYGLPRITEIPEALRPLWGQLLEDAEADLSVNSRAAIQCYPFISDPRRAHLPADEDLPTLIEFLSRRAAHAHQPTPPPEEESNWRDEGEAGPSGSK